jgi:transcription initiation factor TFIID TATA-box-binding protein
LYAFSTHARKKILVFNKFRATWALPLTHLPAKRPPGVDVGGVQVRTTTRRFPAFTPQYLNKFFVKVFNCGVCRQFYSTLQEKMEIRNVVTSVNFECKFDLKHLLASFKGDIEASRAFNAVILRINGKSFCQAFPNGKCIVSGGKSVEESTSLAEAYQSIFLDLGYSATISRLAVVNIVATFDLGRPVNLHNLAKANNFYFEPELFPAVKVRVQPLHTTLHIFHTGKCTILGATSEDVVNSSVSFLTDLIT